MIKPIKIIGEGSESVEELEDEDQSFTDELYYLMGGIAFCEEALEAMRG